MYEVPKFKDKVIYFQSFSNGELVKRSYTVSASYSGILRLSPNNHELLKNSSSDIGYIDPVESFLENSPIVVSDSDGNILDLYYTSSYVFSNNVYCIGQLKTKSLYIHNEGEEEPFNISGIAMPSFINTSKTSGDPEDSTLDVPYGDDLESTIDYFEVLLKDGDGWTYKNMKETIVDVIKDVLLSAGTVPTGSIQYVPITAEQYYALSGRPNVVGYTDEEGRIISSDPIVRDYLLCDGRRYLTRDFPELAKIINNETVSYRRDYNSGEKSSFMCSETYNDYPEGVVYKGDLYPDITRKRLYEHVNGSESDCVSYVDTTLGNKATEEIHTFRVPDLRNQFPRSLILGSSNNSTSYNQTGKWFIDAIPKGEIEGSLYDRHYHFTYYCTHDACYTEPSFYPINKGFVEVAQKIRGIYYLNSDTPSVAITSNNAYFPTRYGGDSNDTLFRRIGNPGWGESGEWQYKRYPSVYGLKDTAWTIQMAGPKTTDENSEPDCGLTSVNISRVRTDGENSSPNFQFNDPNQNPLYYHTYNPWYNGVVQGKGSDWMHTAPWMSSDDDPYGWVAAKEERKDKTSTNDVAINQKTQTAINDSNDKISFQKPLNNRENSPAYIMMLPLIKI